MMPACQQSICQSVCDKAANPETKISLSILLKTFLLSFCSQKFACLSPHDVIKEAVSPFWQGTSSETEREDEALGLVATLDNSFDKKSSWDKQASTKRFRFPSFRALFFIEFSPVKSFFHL